MKNEMEQISKLFEALPSQKKSFLSLGKWKNYFLLQNNWKFLCNTVHNGNTTSCAKFGHVIMDFPMYVAISMCICLGIQTSSYYIGHFVKVFFQTCCSASLIIFPQTSAQKMALSEGISFFESFSFSLFFKNGVKLEVLIIETKRFGIPTCLFPSSSTTNIGA